MATETLPKLSATDVATTFLLVSSIKWLLVPSYRSTDFDVHRNWLAITRHAPLSEWYFNDVNGTTVHTLDYPPLFAFFEAALSNNFITQKLLDNNLGGLSVDERCFELLPDVDNDPSGRCVRFQRATVILSDALLFLGAYLASRAAYSRGSQSDEANAWTTFLLIVTNPGLIILDHVHFQYNGMLLGILLCSIAFMIHGSQYANVVRYRQSGETSFDMCSSARWLELGAAATFAALLAMKHLYLTLAPLYLFYLLRHHCFVSKRPTQITNAPHKSAITGDAWTTPTTSFEFSLGRFLSLALVTLIFFSAPFVPFLLQSDPIAQMHQIFKRLFPFGRGLVHDYWAANLWALYLFTSKVATFLFRKIPLPNYIRSLVETFSLIPFPEPSPLTVALCLLIGLIPGMICAWKIAEASLIFPLHSSLKATRGERLPQFDPVEFLIQSMVFSSLSGFMLAYHVHEKAIMTAIIPLTLISTKSRKNARLFIRTCMFGYMGLLPLLFRPEELLFKITLCSMWMCGSIYCLEKTVFNESTKSQNFDKGLFALRDVVVLIIMALVLLFMEVIHPIFFLPKGQLEFLPLMMTSVLCAVGLLDCWIQSCAQIILPMQQSMVLMK